MNDPPDQPVRLLLDGPPKVGKTVVMRRLVELLREPSSVANRCQHIINARPPTRPVQTIVTDCSLSWPTVVLGPN